MWDQSDIWSAAKHGDVAVVKEFVENKFFDLRSHHDGHSMQIIDGERVKVEGGGMTLLHYACWNGHNKLAEYLVTYSKTKMGDKGCKDVVNAVDTAYNMSTPLIEASRTVRGELNDQLRICKLLVEHGASVLHTDTRKENCLHWAVRRSRLPIVRYFVQHTSAAVEAASAMNFKKQLPIDLAADNAEKNKNTASEGVHTLLKEFKKGMNFRLKIQKGKTRRLETRGRILEHQRLEQERILEETRVLVEQVNNVSKNVYAQAEQLRQSDLSAVKASAAEKALEEAQKWLGSKEGKAFLKAQVAKAVSECKKLVKQGKMKKSRNMTAQCTAKIKAHLFAEKEMEAEVKAEEEFNSTNPPFFHEERLFP